MSRLDNGRVTVTTADLRALRSPDGESALAAADALDPSDPLRAISDLRAAGHDHALSAAALTQSRLRGRAETKFGLDAHRMYFTPDGLEQATRSIVATRRAARFAAAGARRLVDLGCGIGADLIAFARAGIDVTGVDLDPATTEVASANIDVLGLTDRARVVCADAISFDVSGFDAAFCDPARRSGGRRVFDPNAYSPPLSFLLDLADRVPLTAVKIAPGIDHALVPLGAEAEWVSVDGDVVEAALWFGALASARHRATLLPSGVSMTGGGRTQGVAGPINAWLYDPDGAVVRSHLVAELADQLGGSLLDPAIAYLSSPSFVDTPFARAYQVIEVLPFSIKRLRAAMRERNVGRLTIKKRGFAMTPEQVRAQLRLSGSEELTVVLTRIGTAPTAILC